MSVLLNGNGGRVYACVSRRFVTAKIIILRHVFIRKSSVVAGKSAKNCLIEFR